MSPSEDATLALRLEVRLEVAEALLLRLERRGILCWLPWGVTPWLPAARSTSNSACSAENEGPKDSW
jgi:hypothetical protein